MVIPEEKIRISKSSWFVSMRFFIYFSAPNSLYAMESQVSPCIVVYAKVSSPIRTPVGFCFSSILSSSVQTPSGSSGLLPRYLLFLVPHLQNGKLG